MFSVAAPSLDEAAVEDDRVVGMQTVGAEVSAGGALALLVGAVGRHLVRHPSL